MTTKQLTDKKVKNAQPKEVNGVLKDNYFPDGGGLYLIVTKAGGKLWRYHFSFQNKKYRLPLGKYPQLSLKEARQKHIQAKSKKEQGINPVKEKRQKKKAEKLKEKSSFKEVSEEFLKKQEGNLAPTTLKKHHRALERDFYPFIGNKPINEIERSDLVKIAKKIQDRGALETAHRLLNLCGQIWRYALQLDKVPHNIVADISKSDVLKPFTSKQHRTITDPKRIGQLMIALDEYHGEYTTRGALKFLAHTFVRPSNVRFAEWKEIDYTNKMWVIPAEKMKTRVEHRLPLSDQAIAILKEIEPYTIDAKYIFHSPISRNKPLSDVSLSKALKRIEFGSEIVPHGFRAMFSTLAYESGKFRGEVIEALLSHKDPNEVRRAYNRASYEDEKREVIMWWGEFLEGVKNGC